MVARRPARRRRARQPPAGSAPRPQPARPAAASAPPARRRRAASAARPPRSRAAPWEGREPRRIRSITAPQGVLRLAHQGCTTAGAAGRAIRDAWQHCKPHVGGTAGEEHAAAPPQVAFCSSSALCSSAASHPASRTLWRPAAQRGASAVCTGTNSMRQKRWLVAARRRGQQGADLLGVEGAALRQQSDELEAGGGNRGGAQQGTRAFAAARCARREAPQARGPPPPLLHLVRCQPRDHPVRRPRPLRHPPAAYGARGQHPPWCASVCGARCQHPPCCTAIYGAQCP